MNVNCPQRRFKKVVEMQFISTEWIVSFFVIWSVFAVSLGFLLSDVSFNLLFDIIPYLFAFFPFLIIIRPDWLGYIIVVFLPFQQLLLCLAYTYNPEWATGMKWILGWKDLSVLIVFGACFLKYKEYLAPKEKWEFCIFIYFLFMILMMLRMNYPFMMKLASLRFYVMSFSFLLAGFYLSLSKDHVKLLLKVVFWVVFAVIAFGVFEVLFLTDDHFLSYINIGGFKVDVHKTGVVPTIGSYLYAPGFLHKRRMVSALLGSTSTGHFLSFALCLALACRKEDVGIKNKLFQLFFILLIVYGTFMTTSRLSMLEIAAIGAVFLFMETKENKFMPIFIGAAVAIAIVFIFGDTIVRVLEITLNAADASTQRHIHSILTTPVSLVGEGLGAGANVFADEETYNIGEGLFNKTINETGLVGFIFFGVAYGAIFFHACRVINLPDEREETRLAKALCLMGSVYLITMIPSVFISVVIYSSVSHGIFWFMLGVGFRMQREARIYDDVNVLQESTIGINGA